MQSCVPHQQAWKWNRFRRNTRVAELRQSPAPHPSALRVLLPPHHGVVHTRCPDHQLVDNLPFPPPVSAALAATLATLTAAMTQPETRPNTFGGKVWCSKGFPQCRCSAEAAGAPYSLTPSPLHSFTPSVPHSSLQVQHSFLVN